LLILLGWQALMPKPQIVENKEVASIKLNSTTLSTPTVVGTTSEAVAINLKDNLKFLQDTREIVFKPAHADIYEVNFKDGLEHRFSLTNGLFSGEEQLFKQQNRTSDSITFVYENNGKRVVKKFTIPKDSYTIDLEIQIKNLTNQPLIINPQLVLGRINLISKSPYQDVFFSTKDKSMHIAAGKDYSGPDLKFIGIRDQYFCAILEPKDLMVEGYQKKITPQESEVGIFAKEQTLKPGEQIGHFYKMYLGPQDLKIIGTLNSEWTQIIHFGTFDFIAQILVQALGFFFNIVHNWGLAIILLSLAVYFLLYPLSVKQMRSMKAMQALQPKIEALRQEYKNNPQRLNKEIMDLYKEHKVNPLGGCLPLLLQMPIFFALYQALMRSTALRGAQFLWIKDLSSPDRLFVLDKATPLIGGFAFNILPILMAIGMFVQQKISMVQATGEAAQQQKIMSIIMPIMFGVIFYKMPSGLVLYWFVNSVLMLIYQFRINRNNEKT